MDFARLTKSFAQLLRNLANVRDLFHRRANKSRQTFPFRLTNDSQPATKFFRRSHRRIVRERSTYFRQRMIERKIIMDDAFACASEEQRVAALLDVNRLSIN